MKLDESIDMVDIFRANEAVVSVTKEAIEIGTQRKNHKIRD